MHERGGRVYAWTVNSRAGIERMRALGVDGVITDDPRLFHPARRPRSGSDRSRHLCNSGEPIPAPGRTMLIETQ